MRHSIRSSAASAPSTAGRCRSVRKYERRRARRSRALTDVQHLVVSVPEQIDAGSGRGAERERPLGVDLADTRRRELHEIGNGPCAALLCEPQQLEEDLRRRLRVRKRPVARPSRRPEELRERHEAGARGASREEPAREPDRIYDRSRQPGACQPLRLAVEERQVEARVVSDEHRVAGEREEPPHGDPGARLSAQRRVAKTRQCADRRPDRRAGIHQRLELLRELELMHAHRPDLADARRAGAQAGRLQVDDDERRVLQQEVGSGRIRQADRIPAPRQSGVLDDDLVEEAPCQPQRGVP